MSSTHGNNTAQKRMLMTMQAKTEKSYCLYQAFFDNKGNWTHGEGGYWFPISVTHIEKKVSRNNRTYYIVIAPEWLFKKYNLEAENL